MLVRAIIRAVLYGSIGMALLFLAIAMEVAHGAGTSHPVWNREYDWSPTVMSIVSATSTLAIIRTGLESVRLRRKIKKIRVNADTSWGKEHPVVVRATS